MLVQLSQLLTTTRLSVTCSVLTVDILRLTVRHFLYELTVLTKTHSCE